jgi:anthranilate synthase component 1
MNQLSKDEFLKLSKQGNLIPVFKEILGDMETPVSAYLRLSKKSKYSFLLESVEGQEKVARYSFIARSPELVVRSKGSAAEIIRLNKGKVTKESLTVKDSPLSLVRELMSRYKFVAVPQLPVFCGGMVGFLSYDSVRFFERLPDQTADELQIADMIFVMAKELLIFDHLHHKIKVIACAEVDAKDSAAVKIRKYNEALKKIDELIKDMEGPLPKSAKPSSPRPKQIKVKSNISPKEFEESVIKAKKEIKEGEIIQIVLSQRFEVDIYTDSFNIYRTLRAVNPSPYMFYLKFDDLHLVGSSPELLVRCEHGLVETRPIAGTRPRGKDEAEDEALGKELLADPKERAEHVMLVDLGRNDLGRVCAEGTVKVSEFMGIERYSHVMHIVSNVQGRLTPGMDALDVLEAAFPAGTVSGAPKIRAMEIIERLEPSRSGPYAGCVGYLSFSKNLDTCITIRTIVVKGNKAYIQAGAGIVADSDPRKEYQETLNKAKAQIKAIEMAHT